MKLSTVPARPGLPLTAIAWLMGAFGYVRADPPDRLLFDFAGPGAGSDWQVVNDNVMGGVSKGAFEIQDDGSLLFSGTLSLANNGGFSSIRSRSGRIDLSAYQGLRLRVRGDGRPYWLTVQTDLPVPAGSYRFVFNTRAGQWQEVRAPFTGFEVTSFGRTIKPAPPLRTSQVRSIGLLIADKNTTPFKLEVDWIRAYGETAAPAATTTRLAGPSDIVETASASGRLKTFLAAVKAAGLTDALRVEGPLTLFAPTDDAFAKLRPRQLADLLKPENTGALAAVLACHIVPGRLTLGRQTPMTLEGPPVDVLTDGPFRINGAKVVAPDVPASNGLVHLIDTVLTPTPDDPELHVAAQDVIESAIERGVPLFNAGQPGMCKVVYQAAIQRLRTRCAGQLTDAEQEELQQALLRTRGGGTDREHGWLLRRVMDQVYARLRRASQRG